MNNQTPDSGFLGISLLHSQSYASVKIVLNTAAAAASCCFIFISRIIIEAEIYDANNKRSLYLSDYKKQRCLDFWKFAHFFRIFIKRTKSAIELTNPQVSVQNMKLLMRWNKTLQQYFPAVKNNQCPNSVFLEI